MMKTLAAMVLGLAITGCGVPPTEQEIAEGDGVGEAQQGLTFHMGHCQLNTSGQETGACMQTVSSCVSFPMAKGCVAGRAGVGTPVAACGVTIDGQSCSFNTL